MSENRYVIFSSDYLRDEEEESDQQPSGSERRRHQRFRVGVFAEIERPSRHSSKIPGITYNLSRSGALLLTMGSAEPGEEITVSFISSSNERETTPVRVVHGDRFFTSSVWNRRIGVEFIDTVPSFLQKELDVSG